MVVFLVLTLFLSPAQAADSANVIGTAGEFGRETGTRGAMANRKIADQLYQQAVANDKAAWSGGIPNVALLSKALQQSKDAKAADDQAKEFARAALHATNTGAHSGDFINNRYGMVDESKLKELSSTSSPYMPQAEKSLGRYGMKLSADKMSLETPFGKFATNSDDSTLLKAASKIFSKLGLSTASIEKGMKDAIAEREALAKKVIAEIDSNLGKQKPGEDSRAPASLASSMPSPDDRAIGAQAGSEAIKTFEASVENSQITDWKATEQAVLESRKALGRSLGMNAQTDPLGRSSQDIFRMIHLRYQSLDSEGSFLAK
jgi:hypothetical protein